jgi:Flp pilus assembly protein TadD
MPGADAIAGDSSRPIVRPSAFHAVLVAAAAFAVYANALPNAFLWDDVFLVVGNPAIKRWDAVPALFTSDLFPGAMRSGYYRPLQALTYALDYAVWGLVPAGFRLTNVAWHAAAAVLLYAVGVRVLAAATAALLAALVFAVHPIHVEAVAYVAGRSDPLSAALLLGAVLAFLRSRTSGLRGGPTIHAATSGDRAGELVSAGLYFLALLAREAALVLPLVLAVLDRVPPRGARRPLRDYWPHALALAIYAALRAASVAPGAPPATAAVPLGFRLLTTAEVIVQYLAILLVPHGLHMERAVAPVTSLLDPAALAAAAAVGALVAAAVRLRERAWPVTAGVAWFLVALLPVANVVPLATFMAEHWLYVPVMGLCLALGWAAARTPAGVVVAAVVIVLFAGLTVRRNVEWRDARTLYEHLLPLAPESLRVRVNLAQAYQDAGESARARTAYEEVVRRWPDRPETADALNNLGNLERDAGRSSAALAAFDAALALQPSHVAARNGRALVLQTLGRADEAERELATALAIDPASATTHSNLGIHYFRAHDVTRARDAYREAVRLDPDHADAHNNLGSAYYRLGERALAEREYRTALRLDPRSAGAQRNLAIVLGASPDS